MALEELCSEKASVDIKKCRNHAYVTLARSCLFFLLAKKALNGKVCNSTKYLHFNMSLNTNYRLASVPVLSLKSFFSFALLWNPHLFSNNISASVLSTNVQTRTKAACKVGKNKLQEVLLLQMMQMKEQPGNANSCFHFQLSNPAPPYHHQMCSLKHSPELENWANEHYQMCLLLINPLRNTEAFLPFAF